MVDRFLSYVEKVSTILSVDMPKLSAEIQTLTPEEVKRIFEDAKEEIQNFTTYRIYEVTKNFGCNLDDLAELPIILATLTKKLGEELLYVKDTVMNLKEFFTAEDFKERVEKLKGVQNAKEAYIILRGEIPKPKTLDFNLGGFPKQMTMEAPSLGGFGFGQSTASKTAEGEQK